MGKKCKHVNIQLSRDEFKRIKTHSKSLDVPTRSSNKQPSSSHSGSGSKSRSSTSQKRKTSKPKVPRNHKDVAPTKPSTKPKPEHAHHADPATPKREKKSNNKEQKNGKNSKSSDKPPAQHRNEDGTHQQTGNPNIRKLWFQVYEGVKERLQPPQPPPVKKTDAKPHRKTELTSNPTKFDYQPPKYPTDYIIQYNVKGEDEQRSHTHDMIYSAAKMIVVTSIHRIYMDLKVAFEKESDFKLGKCLAEKLDSYDLTSDYDFVGVAVKILRKKKMTFDFTCTGVYELQKEWLSILFAWGVFMDEKDGCRRLSFPKRNCKNPPERPLLKETFDQWIKEKWFGVLRRTLAINIPLKPEFFVCHPSGDINMSFFTKKQNEIYNGILQVSEAMCVSQVVEAESNSKTPRDFPESEKQAQSPKRSIPAFQTEHKRAEYVADYLCWLVLNAVKREGSEKVELVPKRKQSHEHRVGTLATLYRSPIQLLKGVKQHPSGCVLHLQRWKQSLALMYMVATVIFSCLVAILNMGSRDNLYERVMDSTATASLLLVTFFGLVKLESEDAHVLKNTIKGRKITSSFRDVARYVCKHLSPDGNYDDYKMQIKLAFLLHLVEDNRLWLSSSGTCYVRGKTGGSIVPHVSLTGHDLARAGSIFGSGVLLAPDWKTFYAIEGNERHASLAKKTNVAATGLNVTGETEFSGSRNFMRQTWEEVYESV